MPQGLAGLYPQIRALAFGAGQHSKKFIVVHWMSHLQESRLTLRGLPVSCSQRLLPTGRGRLVVVPLLMPSRVDSRVMENEKAHPSPFLSGGDFGHGMFCPGQNQEAWRTCGRMQQSRSWDPGDARAESGETLPRKPIVWT